MESTIIPGRFQKNITTLLPTHICVYILQFCNNLDYGNIYAYADKQYDEYLHDGDRGIGATIVTNHNIMYLHSRIVIKVYPIWRLVSKYYYYIDSNSNCNFCIGRYKYFNKNIKCNNCGHVDNLKYYTNNWTEAFHKRQEQITSFREKHRQFELSNRADLYSN